jgi:YHS domain-containing protein
MNKQTICPVCAMNVAGNEISAEYLSIHYLFCSEQCRKNFLSRPGLYIGKDAAKTDRQEILKCRKFRLDQPLTTSQREKVSQEIRLLMGIKQVDVQSQAIAVTYELRQCRAEQIEACLSAAGIKLGEGWSDRLCLGWIHYTEENELENLAAQPGACCSRPPKQG